MSADFRGERSATARHAVTLVSPTTRYNPPVSGRGFSANRLAPTIAGLILPAVLVAGCGGSNGPAGAGSGSIKTRLVAYSRCMRSHGVSDFPEPSRVPGGGYAFQINAGPGSDLNRSNPTFKTAGHACRAVSLAGQPGPDAPAPEIAAEVKWARCLRSHGVPSFPDPNRSGAIDSSRFDPGSPAFARASAVCKSVQPTGPITAVPGPG
jgi:hypothetical protein